MGRVIGFFSERKHRKRRVRPVTARSGRRQPFKIRANKYSNGLDYDVKEGSVSGFMKSHNKRQRIYMHALLHSSSAKSVPYEKRKRLHDTIVKRDIKGGMKHHDTPL